jgi:general secretion pathway protein A
VAAAQPWLLAPAAALRGLWALYADPPVPPDPCVAGAALRCARAEADTWQDLLPLGRPLVLELVTPARFAAAALVLAVDAASERVLLAGPEGIESLPLAQLAPLWSGGYRYLWHAPAGFEEPLGEGDRGPAVAAVAERFARLDRQASPLAGELFTAGLRRRVELFQRTEGLAVDGYVGPQTLLRLNSAAGLVPAPEVRQARWQRLLEGGFRP